MLRFFVFPVHLLFAQATEIKKNLLKYPENCGATQISMTADTDSFDDLTHSRPRLQRAVCAFDDVLQFTIIKSTPFRPLYIYIFVANAELHVVY